MDYVIRVALVNEDAGIRYSEFDEPLASEYLKADGSVDTGKVYKAMQREYGRCESSIYRDRKDGPSIRTGWYFKSRQEYGGTHGHYAHESYIRGAWVEVQSMIPEQRKAVEI